MAYLLRKAKVLTVGCTVALISLASHNTLLRHLVANEGEEPPMRMPDGWYQAQAEQALEIEGPVPFPRAEDPSTLHSALVSLEGVRAFRSAEERAHGEACFRHGQGFVHLLHMRKAGGTTMRRYLDDLARGNRERIIYATEGDTFNVSCFRDQGEMVTVTTLRHPIERIKSAYWYEGRFEVGQRSQTAELEKRGMGKPFSEWVTQTLVHEKSQHRKFAERRVWSSVDDYYVKTLTNRYRRNVEAPVTLEDFELAKRILTTFDLVVITEWMSWENQTRYMNDMFGQPYEKLWQRNRLRGKRNDNEIDPSVLDELRTRNFWDLLLYDYALKLVDSRIADYLQTKKEGRDPFPNHQVLDCRNPVNDPRWRADGNFIERPNPDSFLYSRPYCMSIDFKRDLIQDLW